MSKKGNEYILDDKICYIVVKRKGVQFKALIDICCMEVCKNYTWKIDNRGYVASNIKINGKTKTILLHRLITNCEDGYVVDHTNHDILDNRIENLRVCLQSDNSKNRKSVKSASGYSGVSFDKERNKWAVRISIDGKNKRIGRYCTLEEAIEVRKQYELKYYGEYSYCLSTSC